MQTRRSDRSLSLLVELGLSRHGAGLRAGRVHDSSRGLGQVLFASDLPLLPMGKAMAAARVLPLTDTAANASLDGTAAHLLHLN